MTRSNKPDDARYVVIGPDFAVHEYGELNEAKATALEISRQGKCAARVYQFKTEVEHQLQAVWRDAKIGD